MMPSARIWATNTPTIRRSVDHVEISFEFKALHPRPGRRAYPIDEPDVESRANVLITGWSSRSIFEHEPSFLKRLANKHRGVVHARRARAGIDQNVAVDKTI